MAKKIPSDEMGVLRCSDLDVPVFEIEDFTAIAKIYLRDLTQFQWKILANEFIEPGIIRILSSMLFELVNVVIIVIYQHVAPQVQDWLCNLPVPGPSNTMTQTGIESLPERNYTTVTEDDIHASIGDSLHFCFGETIDEKQWRSHYSEQLTELFVAEVTKGVNCKLSDITSCAWDLPQKAPFTISDTKDMVYYVGRIFSLLIKKDIPSFDDGNVMSILPLTNKEAFQIPQDQEYPDNVSSEGLTSVLGQHGSALSDGGNVGAPEDLQFKLGTEEAREINSLLDELRSVLSGGEDAKVQGDQECLDRGSCPDKVTCIEVLSAEVVAETEREGSVLSGGDDIKAQECLDWDSSEGSCPDEVTNVEVFNAEDDADAESVPEREGSVPSGRGVVKVQECLDRDCSEGSCPDEVTNVEVFSAEDAEEINSTPEQQGSVHLDDRSPSASSTKGSLKQEKSVLAVFLGNLLTQIANAAKTPKFDVDFDGMVERLNKKIAGQITLLQSAENAHIPVCKELCRMFGSANMLQAAVVTREAIFIDAVARTLEVQLHKSTRKTSSFATKLKRFFGGRKAKVSPSCEINTTESHSVVIKTENVSTPPPQKKQKCPVIVRMFRILCRPFSSCISSGSQD